LKITVRETLAINSNKSHFYADGELMSTVDKRLAALFARYCRLSGQTPNIQERFFWRRAFHFLIVSFFSQLPENAIAHQLLSTLNFVIKGGEDRLVIKIKHAISQPIHAMRTMRCAYSCQIRDMSVLSKKSKEGGLSQELHIGSSCPADLHLLRKLPYDDQAVSQLFFSKL